MSCSPSAPGATSTIPSGSASSARNRTSSRRRRCGRCSRTSRTRWRTPSGSPTSANSVSRRSTSCPSSPAPPSTPSTRACWRRWPAGSGASGTGRPLPADRSNSGCGYELGVINKAGYAGYFLIVQDFIAAARAREIPVGPGRGSAAGSLVAYALRITDIDPLQVRPAVRAVPEPRAGLDAGHRRRFLLRATGRGHRLRPGTLRPPERGPDHHLRDAEGPRRGEGRGPGAEDSPGRRRQDHQADPFRPGLQPHPAGGRGQGGRAARR